MVCLTLFGYYCPNAQNAHDEEQDQRYDTEHKNRHDDPQGLRLCCGYEHKSVISITESGEHQTF
jgi:hypothetical protein